jgi:hypothetical protein
MECTRIDRKDPATVTRPGSRPTPSERYRHGEGYQRVPAPVFCRGLWTTGLRQGLVRSSLQALATARRSRSEATRGHRGAIVLGLREQGWADSCLCSRPWSVLAVASEGQRIRIRAIPCNLGTLVCSPLCLRVACGTDSGPPSDRSSMPGSSVRQPCPFGGRGSGRQHRSGNQSLCDCPPHKPLQARASFRCPQHEDYPQGDSGLPCLRPGCLLSEAGAFSSYVGSWGTG